LEKWPISRRGLKPATTHSRVRTGLRFRPHRPETRLRLDPRNLVTKRRFLAENRAEILTRDQLLDEVWGRRTLGDAVGLGYTKNRTQIVEMRRAAALARIGQETAGTMTWIKAASIDALRIKPAVVRHGVRQIAVFARDDRVFAIDNRCPHEGYPLAVGGVSDDCVLTCNWHNWKFRLDTGECVLGGDDVRSYAAKIVEGDAWIDVVDPPLAETRARVLKGLKRAFEERDFGRICREIARLHYYGLDMNDAVRAAVEWSYDKFEFGTTHAIAAAADWVHLANASTDFERQLICVAEAVDHFAFDALRHRAFPFSGPSMTAFDAAAFADAVETEEARRAEAIAARALADGLHWSDLEEAFAAAAFAHYNDFGHSVIYVAKTGELVAALGPGVERLLILPLARHLVYATREDLLPEFADCARTLEALPEPRTNAASDAPLPSPFPAASSKAFQWLHTSLASYDVSTVYNSLLEALALNMLCYDARYGAAYDRPVSDNIGWLDFTHGLTFANAARRLCSKHPRFWKVALTQMACFLGRNSRYLDRSILLDHWSVTDRDAFFAETNELLLDHGQRDPIFSAHLLKTTLAVREELQSSPDACSTAMLAALNRFLHSPIKAKHVRRLARQAIDLVRRDFEP